MSQQKALGKLTQDQLRSFVHARKRISELRSHLWAEFQTLSEDARRGLLEFPFEWATAYEMPFAHHLAAFSQVSGGMPALLAAAQAPDPHQALVDWIQGDALPWVPDPQTKLALQRFLGLLESLAFSLESLFIYGRSLNRLVADVRSGIDESLFKAIRIDRAVLGCPCVANRLCRAQLEGDEAFFKQLRNALSGPPKKIRPEYADLRFALALLQEAGAHETLSEEESYQLLCVDLGLYPVEGEDPARSLRRFIQRWKREHAT